MRNIIKGLNWEKSLVFLTFAFVFLVFVIYPIYLGQHNQYLGPLGDPQQFIWQSKNLLNVIRTGNTFVSDSYFGIVTPYAYTPTSIVQGLLFIFLDIIIGNSVIAYNLTVGFFLNLNFATFYYVLKKLKRSTYSSLLFSSVFAFLPSTLLHSFFHISLFITFVIPLFFYQLILFSKNQSRKRFVYISVLFVLTFYIHEYFGFFIAISSFIYFVIFNKRLLRRQNLQNIILSLLLIIFLLLPLAKIYFDKYSYNKDKNISQTRDINEGYLYSSNPANYISPYPDNNLYKTFKTYIYKPSYPIEQVNYSGITTIIIAIISSLLIIKKKINIDNRISLYFAIVGGTALIFSFGPYIKLNEGILYLPVYFLYKIGIPILNEIRGYGRFGIFATTILILGVSYTYDLLTKKLAESVKILIFLLLIIFNLFEFIPFQTVPRSKIEVPSILKTIKLDSQDGFVLNVPFRTEGSSTSLTAMIFQTVHKKKIVNTYSSFKNPFLEEKVKMSYAGCFDWDYYKDVKCDSLFGRYFLDENIRYIVFEKQTTEAYPLNLSLQEEVLVRNSFLAKFEGITSILYEDDVYIIGKVKN